MAYAGFPEGWRASYEQWLEGAHSDLEQKNWKQAFSHYPRMRFPSGPFHRPARPVSASRVALISSAGLTLPHQEPFSEDGYLGDPSFRIIEKDADLSVYDIHHGHYNPSAAREDVNSVLPLAILKDVAQEGALGEVAPRHIVYQGYQPDPDALMTHAFPGMLRTLQEDHVDAALLVPV